MVIGSSENRVQITWHQHGSTSQPIEKQEKISSTVIGPSEIQSTNFGRMKLSEFKYFKTEYDEKQM